MKLTKFSRLQRKPVGNNEVSSLIDKKSDPILGNESKANSIESDEKYVTSNLADKDAECFGCIEVFNGFIMSGWYFSIRSGHQKLKILFDGNILETIISDLERLDVKGARQDAPALCGFSINLAKYRILGRVEAQSELEKRLAVVDENNMQLRHCYDSPYKNIDSARISGSLDGVDGHAVRGWAIGLDENTASISIIIDGLFQGNVDADLYREDVGVAIGKANTGFLYPIAHRFLDGRRHTIRCTYAQTNTDLPGSPIHLVLRNESRDNISRAEGLMNIFLNYQTQFESFRAQIASEAFKSLSYVQNYSFFRDIFRASRMSEARLRKLQLGATMPVYSIVMPTYKSNLVLLTAAIDSVVAQTDRFWELIVSDSSSSVSVREYLQNITKADSRIKVLFHDSQLGIAENTNIALKEASGEFIGFMDHDDELAPEAISLFRMAFDSNKYDIIYSDEDKIDLAGNFVNPHFKPAFNLDLFLCMNYLCHFVVVRKELLFKTSLLRSAYNGAQDWDLLLQLISLVPHERIGHIPRILYHWRMSPGSTASAISEKSYAVEAGVSAVRNYIAETNLNADVALLDGLPYVDVNWRAPKNIKISVLIPTKDRIDLLTNCVNSVLATSGSQNLEIIIIDNNSSPSSKARFQEMCSDNRIIVIQYDGKFNYSAINNFAARRASGEYLLLLNNDVFFTRAGWLERMIGVAFRAEVGAVGLKLLYPDNTVQHCGVVVGNGGVAGHAFAHLPADEPGYLARAACTQEVSAVTAACLLVRLKTFWDVGGLDEQELKIAFNDVDFCLKVQRAGLHNILVASTFAYHAESISRGYEDTLEKVTRFNGEVNAMKKRWGSELLHDRFYSPNFDLQHACYTVIDLPSVVNQELIMSDNPIVR